MKQTIALWSMVKVHGLMVADSVLCPINKILGRRETAAFDVLAAHLGVSKSNVVDVQPIGWPVPEPKRLKRKFIL